MYVYIYIYIYIYIHIYIYIYKNFFLSPQKFAIWGDKPCKSVFLGGGQVPNPHKHWRSLIQQLKFKMYFFANCHNNNG